MRHFMLSISAPALLALGVSACSAAAAQPEQGPPPRLPTAPVSPRADSTAPTEKTSLVQAPSAPSGPNAADVAVAQGSSAAASLLGAAAQAAATALGPALQGSGSANTGAAGAQTSPSPGDATAKGTNAGPAACPADMKLVEGDYCTEVDHKCLIEWYAPQNKKVICEQFDPSAKCVGSRVPKRFCIDTYEWPNQKDVRPEVMNHFYQAQVKCAAAGKRMCTESEWNFACEGPEMKPFPYGYVRDPKKCNGDHAWDAPNMKKVAARDPKELARLWQGVPSGSQPDCISDFGVADMPGNADEVVAGESPKAKFASVNTGGPWYSGVRNQCRPKVYTHNEGFYYYYLSFRYCAAPENGANEWRTKKQVADGLSWKNIERLAGFSVEEMKEKLELKKAGQCTCGQGKKGILCKTMCGTLLGPNAQDGTDATRVLNEKRKKIK